MPNPTLHSDILKDDGAIDAAIAKLEKLGKTGVEALEKVQKAAANLEGELDDVSSSSKGNKEKLEESAKEAAKLEAEYKKLTDTLSENGKKLALLREGKVKANQIAKNEAKLVLAAEGSYNQLSAQYSLIKIRLNEMSSAQRETTEEGRALVKQSKEIHDEMKRLQAETGNTSLNVGNYKESVKDAIAESGLFGQQLGFLTRVQTAYNAGLKLMTSSKAAMTAATQGASTGLQAFKIALVSTGIGAIVVLLGTLVAAFLSTQEGIDELNKVLTPLKTVFEGIWGAIQNLAIKGFAALKKAVNDPVAALKRLGDIIQDAVIAKLEAFGRLGKAIGKILSGDLKEGFRDLSTAVGDVSGFNDVVRGLDAVANATGEIVSKNYKLGQSIQALRVQLREEEIAFEERKAALERQVAAGRELAADTQKSAAQRERGLNSALSALTKLQKAEESIAKKRVDLAKLEATASDTDAEGRREIARLEGELIRTETDNLNKRKEIVSQLSGIRRQEEQRQATALKLSQDEQIKALENDKAFRLAQFDSMTDFGNKSLEYEQARAVDRFEIEADANKAILELQLKSGRISQQQLETSLLEIQAKRNEFFAKLKADRDKENPVPQALGLNLRDKAIKEATDKIQKQASEALEFARMKMLEEANKGEINNIYDLLGINFGEGDAQFKSALQTAKDELLAFAAVRTQIANQNVENSNREVEEAQRALEIQIQNQAAGSASRIKKAEEDLENAKKIQAKALAEQRRAQAAERRLQTIQQAANLVTASAKIWGQLGFPAALPALAVMWGSFIASKVRANQLAKATNRKGTYLDLDFGGSHESGNDIPFGVTKDGKQVMTAERGEAMAVFTATARRKYGSALPKMVEAMNRGEYDRSVFMSSGNGVGMLNQQTIVVEAGSEKMERHLQTIAENSSRHQPFVDNKGRLVVMYKNQKTAINN